MSFFKRDAVAAEPVGESSTFFAAAAPKTKDDKPAEPSQDQPKPTPQEPPKKPASTFFDTGRGYTDPLTELSTHRALSGSGMTEEERAARKEAQQQRARRGMDWLMSVLTR